MWPSVAGIAGGVSTHLLMAAQPPHVVMDHRALDPVADSGVEAVKQRHGHAPSPTR